jgi:holo-[acyl-carrier protein] synthase
MLIRVGIDLVSVESVSESISAHGDRYLQRVYSDQELADSRTDSGIDPERLAARFAAKEATMKVLRVREDQAIAWREIEVIKKGAGWVELLLSGHAATLAADAGLTGFTVSLSHERGVAAAVVVGLLQQSRER